MEEANFESYLRFRQFISEEISRLIAAGECSLFDLEKNRLESLKKAAKTEQIFAEVLSITSSLDTFPEREFLLRIHSLIQNKISVFDGEIRDFTTMNFLIERCKKASFVRLCDDIRPKHALSRDDAAKTETKKRPERQRLHLPKGSSIYQTFSRNGSWFIVKCGRPVISQGQKTDIDIFGNHDRAKAPISVDTGEKNYAADRLGKRFAAKPETIERLIKPFPFYSSTAKGYVRLFGQKYILLR